MLPYIHFTLEERECLHQLLTENKSMREIAAILGRAPSSVCREINRNKSKHPTSKNSDNKYLYHPWKANIEAKCRRRKGYNYRLKFGTPEFEYVIEKLQLFWTPEQIANRWVMDYPDADTFQFATIYRDLKRERLPAVSRKENLRRRGKKRQTRNANYNTIHPERTIPEWPEAIKLRLRIGDWEGDTIYGAVGKGVIITMVNRRTRYLCAAVVESRDSKLIRDTMIRMMKGLPVESISLDNGSEFAEFKEVEKALNAPIYFAEPHKPWQRGTNENTNDILRFFYAKGFDFHSITQDDLDLVVRLINNRPRKCLNYRTPCEAMNKLGVALA